VGWPTGGLELRVRIVRSNLFIERTCSGALRAPTHAAHVGR